MRAAHAEGRVGAGLDVSTGKPRDLSADGIVDLYQTKWWALRLAVDAAVTVLKVDQIIMVRRRKAIFTCIATSHAVLCLVADGAVRLKLRKACTFATCL